MYAAPGRRAPVGHHPCRPVLLVQHHQPVEAAVREGRCRCRLRPSPGDGGSGVHIWATLVVRWVLTLSPTDFRFARSRWSCEAAAVVLREDYRVTVGRETVRLWLRAADLVWRRPRPTIRPKDPDREKKLRVLRALLEGLPADETAVFMDEVDVNLNPKVGCHVDEAGPAGGRRDAGEQREAVPGREHPLEDRTSHPDRGQAEGGPDGRPVPAAPGRPAAGVPPLQGHPRPLRQRRVPHGRRVEWSGRT